MTSGKTEPPPISSNQSMQSLERAALILRVVASKKTAGAKLADVWETTGISRSTAYRFMAGLAQVGLLEHDQATGTYYLGLDLCEFGTIAANRYGLRDASHLSMIRLTELTGDTVYMSIRRNYEAICIERYEGEYPIKTLTLDVGDRRPLGVGAGSLALLAFQPDDFVARAIAMNAPEAETKWGLSTDRIGELVAETRKNGYACNQGLVAPGMTALGAPIFGADGQAVAALGIGAISSRMDEDRRAQIVAWLLEAARDIELRLVKLLGPLSTQNMNRALSRTSHGNQT